MGDGKIIVPFITFVLGLCSIPFSEYIKSRIQLSSLEKSIKLEQQDEFDKITKNIKITHQNSKARLASKDTLTFLDIPLPPRLTLLNENFQRIYNHLDREKRKAFADLIELNTIMNAQHKKLIENIHLANYQEISVFEYHTLIAMLKFHYLLKKLITDGKAFTYPTLDPIEQIRESARYIGIVL